MNEEQKPAPGNGMVYTETVVHAPPPAYAADAPYQIAIVDLHAGGRLAARILADSPDERVKIGDPVTLIEERNGVAYYRKSLVTETPAN